MVTLVSCCLPFVWSTNLNLEYEQVAKSYILHHKALDSTGTGMAVLQFPELIAALLVNAHVSNSCTTVRLSSIRGEYTANGTDCARQEVTHRKGIVHLVSFQNKTPCTILGSSIISLHQHYAIEGFKYVAYSPTVEHKY